jgi:hypothetical protein
MTAIWTIEQIDATEGNPPTVHWRVSDGEATAYGTVSIEGLTITPSTTEAAVVEKVKKALNAVAEQRDEKGNIIPPMPGKETEKTDAIEASLAAQAAEIAHPKVKSIKLPWVA